jgi:hypothetical protein
MYLEKLIDTKGLKIDDNFKKQLLLASYNAGP